MLKKILFWLLIAGLIMISLDSPMLGVLPMALIVYRYRESLSSFLNRFSLRTAFLGSGLVFGLLTEIFAIVDNLDKPLAERALLSPYPHVDLILGFFWYGLFVIIWYFAFKKYHYSKKEIFFISGLYGLIFEQKGVFLPMLFSPAFLLPIFIMSVYAIFPMLAYELTKNRFPERKVARFFIRYPFALILLAIHVVVWYLFGLFYYPLLQDLGYLGYLNK